MQENASLSDEMMDAIFDFIKKKESEGDFPSRFPNVLIRDDVLDLLDSACTVIYYPLEDEGNNGFHINDIPRKDGKCMQFVFINTEQTTDRQAFTAAHELGHVWGVEEEVAKKCGVVLNDALSEAIINRFAAELLMPEELFRKAFEFEYKNLREDDTRITVFNLLKVIVKLMNRFMTPFKAVVLRLNELEIASEEIVKSLIDDYEDPDGIIKGRIDEIIEEFKFTKLQFKSKRKWINGLAELLDEVEEKQLVLPSKILNMRKAFNIEQPIVDKDMEKVLNVYEKK